MKKHRINDITKNTQSLSYSLYRMRQANLTLERESAGVCCCVVIQTLFGEVRFM